MPRRDEQLRCLEFCRLGELKDKTAETALEGRLGAEEDPALRPLIEVSLQSIRGKGSAGAGNNAADAALAKFNELVAKGKEIWGGLSENQTLVAYGGAGGFGLLVVVWVLLRARRRRKSAGGRIGGTTWDSGGVPMSVERVVQVECGSIRRVIRRASASGLLAPGSSPGRKAALSVRRQSGGLVAPGESATACCG